MDIVVVGDRVIELEPSDPVVGPPPPTVADLIRYREEKAAQGPWIPGNCGTETPFGTLSGRRLLWCWQPTSGLHAYLDVDSDIILTNEEAREVLDTW